MCDEIDALEERRAAEEEFARKDREAREAILSKRPRLTNCTECSVELPAIRQVERRYLCVDCQARDERMLTRFAKAYHYR